MKRLSDTEMMDYLDGALSPEKAAAVEAHLASSAEDAQLLADLRMAQATLHEMAEAEPIRASDDFWLKVREQLPERATQPATERSAAPTKGLMAQIGAWLWPSQSPMGMSLRVGAVVAAILAMLMTMFGPGQIRQPTIATAPTPKALTTDQQRDAATRVPPARDAKPLPGVPSADENTAEGGGISAGASR